MKLKHILYYFILVLFITSCKENIPDPDTDAVYKSITKIYELNENGTSNYQYKHELKYLTHYAFNRAYGESFIVYNPEKQELKINESVTTQVDGTKVPSPGNAYNEVLPRFAAGAPAFNHLREMVVTHAGLEIGCTVNFDYELKSKEGYVPFLNENLLLAEESPIQEMKVVVKIPESKELNYKVLNAKVEPSVSTGNGYKTYTWEFEKIDQLSFEHDQPHVNTTAPRLIFSTVSVKNALGIISASKTMPANIAAKVDEKLKGKKLEFEKAFALQDLVANNINGFHIPIEHTGYITRSFSEIWQSNGATDLEKTLFLSALLNHYKIEAKPIFAYGANIYDENIGLLNNAGHCYVFCKIDDQDLIISASSTKAKNNLAYKLIDDVVIDLEGQKVKLNKDLYGSGNELEIKGEVELFYEGKLSGNYVATLNGYINPYFDIIKDEKKVDGIVKKVLPGIKVTDSKLLEKDNNSSKINFSFELDKAAKKQEEYNFMSLPKSPLGIEKMHYDYLKGERNSPMEIGGPFKEVYDFNMKVPSGFVLLLEKADTTLSNPVGEVTIRLEQTMNGVNIYKSLVLNKKVVAVNEYTDFRDLYLLWNNKKYNELTFKETHK